MLTYFLEGVEVFFDWIYEYRENLFYTNTKLKMLEIVGIMIFLYLRNWEFFVFLFWFITKLGGCASFALMLRQCES